MKKYNVVANDDAMKYQVLDLESSGWRAIMYENDGKNEADEVCKLMNIAYEEGLKADK